MTDRDALVKKISAAMSEGKDSGGYFTLFDMLSHTALKVIEESQSMSGCLHPGNEPLSCQYEGKCLSLACNHNGKTWYGPRMTLEAQDPNVLYPPKGDDMKHHINRTSPKGTPFVGTCALCGRMNLPTEAVHEDCENVRGLSAEDALMEAITGAPKETT